MATIMLKAAVLLALLTVATSESSDHFVCKKVRNRRYGGFAVGAVNHTESAEGQPGNPGSIDYDSISRLIEEKIREGLERLNSKIDMLQNNTSVLSAGLEEVKSEVDTLKNKLTEKVEPKREGWHQASNGYFYKYFASTKTYYEASRECQILNARIIIEGVRNNPSQKRLFDDLGATGQVWIGATDSAREGSWVWNDGNPLRESDITWGEGEPNDEHFSEDCGEYNQHEDGWVANDVPCTVRRSYICEAAN